VERLLLCPGNRDNRCEFCADRIFKLAQGFVCAVIRFELEAVSLTGFRMWVRVILQLGCRKLIPAHVTKRNKEERWDVQADTCSSGNTH
jgi:hypothetical protein